MSQQVACIIYKSQKYFLDLNLFNKYSNYSFGEQITGNDSFFFLVSEFDAELNMSKDTINAFISFFDQQKIDITIFNVFQIQYLSHIYEVPKLIQMTEEFITNHKEELINKTKLTSCIMTEYIEDFISTNFEYYIKGDRLFSLTESQLYRIFIQYLRQNKLTEDIEMQIIEFLAKCIKSNLIDVSILFTLFKFSKKGCKKIIQELSMNQIQMNKYTDAIIPLLIHRIIDIEEEQNQKIEQIKACYDAKIKKIEEEMHAQIEQEKNEKNDEIQKIKESYEAKFAHFEEEKIKQNQKIDEINTKYDAMLNNFHEEMLSFKENLSISFSAEIDRLKKEMEIIKNNHEIEIKKEKEKSAKEVKQLEEKLAEIEPIMNFQENNNYEEFNKLKGKAQKTVISQLFGETNDNKMIQNTINLLFYLSKEQEKANNQFKQINFINLQSNQPKSKLFQSNTFEKIFIQKDVFNLLILNDSIGSKEFITTINQFDEIYVEFEYPSSEYQEIFNVIKSIKNSTDFKLKTKIRISKIDEYDKEFQHNKYINLVTIEPTVSVITGGYKNGFFEGCLSLEKIEIPSSITMIGGGAFSSCVNLKMINIPNSVREIQGGAFSGCESLKEINIPSSITSIENNLFEKCKSLTEISIPSSVTIIKSNSFMDCTSLKTVTIPKSVTIIESSAFEGCSLLTEVEIHDSVTLIGSKAFKRCKSLKEVQIPSSFTKIDEDAFDQTTKIYQLIDDEFASFIRTNKIDICNSFNRFLSLNKNNIFIPFYTTESFYNNKIFNSSNFISHIKKYQKIIIEIKYPSESYIDIIQVVNELSRVNEKIIFPIVFITGIIKVEFCQNNEIKYAKIDSCVDEISFEECKSLTRIVMPPSVVTIKDKAFFNCSSLTKIKIPQSVAKIGNSVFKNCSSLNEIIIPSSVNSIDEWSFAGCKSLLHITIPSSIKTAGNNVFLDCKSLWQVKFENPASIESISGNFFSGCTALMQITIPSSVTSIGSFAFKGCTALMQITIPSSVTSIGDYAFKGCTALNQIIIPSSVTSIGDYAFIDCLSLEQVKIPSKVSIGKFVFPKKTKVIKV